MGRVFVVEPSPSSNQPDDSVIRIPYETSNTPTSVRAIEIVNQLGEAKSVQNPHAQFHPMNESQNAMLIRPQIIL
jgi:hypothetical protein